MRWTTTKLSAAQRLPRLTSPACLTRAVCGLAAESNRQHVCTHKFCAADGVIRSCFEQLWGDTVEASIQYLLTHRQRFCSPKLGCKKRATEVYGAIQVAAHDGGEGASAGPETARVVFKVCSQSHTFTALWCPHPCPFHVEVHVHVYTACAVCAVLLAQVGQRSVCRSTFLLHYPIDPGTLRALVSRKKADFGVCKHAASTCLSACTLCVCQPHILLCALR